MAALLTNWPYRIKNKFCCQSTTFVLLKSLCDLKEKSTTALRHKSFTTAFSVQSKQKNNCCKYDKHSMTDTGDYHVTHTVCKITCHVWPHNNFKFTFQFRSTNISVYKMFILWNHILSMWFCAVFPRLSSFITHQPIVLESC